jgi:hypothetical protein
MPSRLHQQDEGPHHYWTPQKYSTPSSSATGRQSTSDQQQLARARHAIPVRRPTRRPACPVPTTWPLAHCCSCLCCLLLLLLQHRCWVVCRGDSTAARPRESDQPGSHRREMQFRGRKRRTGRHRRRPIARVCVGREGMKREAEAQQTTTGRKLERALRLAENETKRPQVCVCLLCLFPFFSLLSFEISLFLFDDSTYVGFPSPDFDICTHRQPAPPPPPSTYMQLLFSSPFLPLPPPPHTVPGKPIHTHTHTQITHKPYPSSSSPAPFFPLLAAVAAASRDPGATRLHFVSHPSLTRTPVTHSLQLLTHSSPVTHTN